MTEWVRWGRSTFLRVGFWLPVWGMWVALPFRFAEAANPSGDLRVEIISAYNFVVDSNVESPSTYGPRSAYVGAKFCNDGANDMTNVVAYIGNFADGTNDTPGLYPRRTHAPLVGPLTSNMFALTHEGGTAGTADATRYLGTLPAGECVTVYWLISYPTVDANGDAVHGPSVKPEDDLWLEYDIWGKAEDSGATVIAEDTRRVTMRNEISAMANKIVPNTANKVPQVYLDLLQQYAPTWTNEAADGTVGTAILSTGFWYDLGVIGQGFDNNGDLVPDMNAWMQPIGDPSLFDPSAFRLLKTRAMVVVKLKTGGEQVYLTEDQLYFENMPENNGAIGLVIYEFMPMKPSFAAGLTPYQEVASGYDNEKFNGDFGILIGNGFQTSISHITLDKVASEETIALGANMAFTINFANTSTVAFGNAALGVPLVIQDSIPTGTLYVAGSATVSNVLPTGVDHYTVLFSTNNGTSWSGTEPAAGMVTDIQWWLSDTATGGVNGTVRFVVTLTNAYAGQPIIINTAGGSLGNNTPFTNDSTRTVVLGTNRVGDTVFVDDGSGGGGFGNGVQDGSEGGISNIMVTLYYDLNSNGVVDGTDFSIGVTNTATNGFYLFNSLPDGSYVARVSIDDPDLPAGYTITTSSYFSASLDLPRTNAAMVSFLTADWGFAPALVVDKQGGAVLREGTNITYTIIITNRLAGDGGITDYEVWGGVYDITNSGTGNRAWVNYSNVFYPTNAPDGLYATPPMANVDETIATKALFLGQQFGNITSVEFVVYIRTNGLFNGADGIIFHLLEAGSSIYSTSPPIASLTNGSQRYNVTSLKNWSWTNFSGTNNLSVQAIANGGGGGPTYDGVIEIDVMGFRILSDQSPPATNTPNLTVDPLPLTDTYDADLFEFVSASITPDSVSTSGVAPNRIGTLQWNDLGPLYAGGYKSVTVTFRALEPMNNTSSTVTNTAFTLGASYANGRPANTSTDMVTSALLPAGTIGDYVWRDRNANGVQDGGEETGIYNVQVVLTPPPGVDVGRGAGLPVTNLTDTNGYYLFTGLPADGAYTVTVNTVSLPGGSGTNTFDRDGTNNSRTIVDIDYDSTTGGDTVTNADFGYQISSVIRGTVWHDLDRDGAAAPESGEDLLTNVIVYLFNGSTGGSPATAIATNRTGTNGTYQFVGNYTGTYSVLVWTNSGQMSNTGPWTASFDTDGLPSSTNLVAFGIVGGGSAQADFSYYRSGSLFVGDTLFYDWNGNYVQDTNEEGIASITVRLYEDWNTNGVVDTGQDAFIAFTNTSGTGGYLFATLPASNYLIIVDHGDTNMPLSYSVTADPQGVNDGRAIVALTSNRLDQDFGYQPYGVCAIGDTVWFDFNGDGVQGGTRETGLVSITVSLLVDMDLDGVYQTIATTSTGTNGTYLFGSLPAGSYRVRVDTNDTDLPEDSFGATFYPTTPYQRDITVTGSSTNLTADFGFTALGAIGDTVFWDANQNGTQDWNEEGVDGVGVSLYRDVNTNGVFDVSDSFVRLLSTDTNGNYLFSGLTSDYYVVVVSEVGPLLNKLCSADPDADGVPFGPGTDGDYALHLDVGSSYLGADFGYVPNGALGDTVWMDINTNGTFDSTEVGLPYITVELWSNGVLVATNVTDPDGFYLFSDFADSTYRVVVLTNDSDFISGLTNVYTVDGTLDHIASNIVVATGRVVVINGTPCTTNCDMTIDFGYRFGGTNVLSGTVGLDATPYDGILGTGPTGVSTDEAAFGNVSVYLYYWTDSNADTNVNSGETRLIASTTTSTNGDYSFFNLPDGSSTNRYIVSLAAPDVYLRMTTTNGSTPSYRVVETVNLSTNTISAYQIVTIQAVSTNIDFAFYSTVPYDFGDLPQTYLTRFEGVPTGPRHQLRTPANLFLGTNVDSEVNGAPSVDADGDGADENGIVPLDVWRAGTNGGTVQYTVGGGTGWISGFVDFGTNGTFYQAGDMIITQTVSATGVFTRSFNIPVTNAISQTTTTVLYARFRLFPSAAPIPLLSFFGYAANGEVEDYVWRFGAIGDFVWKDTDADALYDTFENAISGVRVYVDLNGDGVFQTNTEPFTTTGTNGYYSIGGFSPGTHNIRVDTNSLPSYLVPTYDQDGTGTPHRAAIAITNGEVRTDADFGYAGMAIGGQIWNDTDTNGLQDEVSLTGVSNVLVRLYDSSTTWVGTAYSDTNGLYIFDIAAPGDFFIEFFPINFTISPIDQGTNDTYDSDVSTNAPYRTVFTTIAAGEREEYWDLGLYRPAQSNTVGDRVWLDSDQDGQIDTNEIGIANVGIALYDTGTNVIRTTVTDVDGFYYFSGLPSNTYFVGFTPPANYTFTVQDTGSDVTDSDPNLTNGYTALFLVTNGFATTNLDAGLIGRLDLGVTKSINNSDPDPSNTVSFTVFVTNSGPLTATDVRYTDVWPSSTVTYVSSAVNRGDYNPTNGIWSIGTMSNGVTATLTMTGTVNAGTAGSYISNVVYLSYLNQSDTNAANNTGIVAVLIRSLDLAITKIASTNDTFEGSNVTYTIVVTNNGPKNATGVVVNEPLPTRLTHVTNTVSQGSFSGTSLVWTVGAIASNASASMTLTALVGTNTGGRSLTNTVTITAVDQYDSVSTNNSSSQVITVRGADIGVSKSSDITIASLGETVVFTVNVTNLGPNAVTNVRVADGVPGGVTHVTNTLSQGSYSPTGGIWIVGDLLVNSGAVMTLTVTVDTNGLYRAVTNIATVSTSSLPDPNYANNSATSRVAISYLKIFKSASPPGPVDLGSNIAYTITVTNSGLAFQTNVCVSDSLPGGTLYVAGSSSLQAPTSALATFLDEFNAIAFTNQNGSTNWFNNWQEEGEVDGAAAGDVQVGVDGGRTNVVWVENSSNGFWRMANVVSNKRVTLSFDFSRQALDNASDALVIYASSSGGSAWAEVGRIAGPSNHSTYVSTSIVISSYISTNMAVRFFTVGMGNDDFVYLDNIQLYTERRYMQTLTGTSPPTLLTGQLLEDGEFTTLNFDVQVQTPPPTDIITNTASVTSVLETTPLTAYATTPVSIADLCVTKDAATNQFNAGDYSYYTIIVTNNGPHTSRAVTLNDYWPTNVTFISATLSQGTYSTNNATNHVWSIGTLDYLAGATLVISGQVMLSVSTNVTITNTAIVSSSKSYDRNSSNDRDGVALVTLIILSRLEAFLEAGLAALEWETASENETIAFAVSRVGEAGEFIRLHTGVLPSVFGAAQGAVYRLLMADMPAAETFDVVLEEMEMDGEERVYGPFEVRAETEGGALRLNGLTYTNQMRLLDLPQTNASSEAPAGGGGGGLPSRGGIDLYSSHNPPVPLTLQVATSGVYYADAATLATLMGTDYATVSALVASASISLTCMGEPVALHMRDDRFYFFAETTNTAHTLRGFYQLAWTNGLVMTNVAGGAPVPDPGVQDFLDSLWFENEVASATATATTPEDDFWFWDFFVAGSPPFNIRSYALTVPHVAPGTTATLRVGFQGVSAASLTSNDHHMTVSVGSNTLGSAVWKGVSPTSLTVTVSSDALIANTNIVIMTSILDAGVPYSITYLDQVDINYRRQSLATNGQLVVADEGRAVVTVDGFASTNILVLGLSTPLQPTVVEGLVFDQTGALNRVSFAPPVATGRYAVTELTSARLPESISIDVESDLLATTNGADYLLISDETLAASAATLAAYREASGLMVKQVRVQDIYDEFTHAVPLPDAIRSFIAYTLTNWTIAPRYVLLAGEGTYDYRNRLNYGDNLVPVLMVMTPGGLFASDGRFADVDGDSRPDLALGRLPARTASDLDRMISRLQAYEAAQDDTWQEQVMFVADDPDTGGDFHASSRRASDNVPVTFLRDEVLMDPGESAAARAHLISGLNDGRLMLNYFGHGGVDRLASEGILTSADVAQLSNSNRLTIISSMSCAMGQFPIPGFDCLGEALMLATNGGAVAVWAPTGLSYNRHAEIYCALVYQAIFEDGQAVLGDAIQSAAAAYQDVTQAGFNYMGWIYNLMGDPALRIGGVRTAGLAPARTVTEWTRSAFTTSERQNPTVSDLEADADNDGESNLMEYLFGLNPRVTQTATFMIPLGRADQYGMPAYDAVYEFTRRKGVGDYAFSLTASTNIAAGWNVVTNGVLETTETDTGDGVTEDVRVYMRHPANGGYLYLKLDILGP